METTKEQDEHKVNHRKVKMKEMLMLIQEGFQVKNSFAKSLVVQLTLLGISNRDIHDSNLTSPNY